MTRIEIVGSPSMKSAAPGVRSRVRHALTSVAGAARTCRVAFSDENGPKGGPAVRCTLDLRVTRAAPIHVVGRATTVALALKEALERLEHRLERRIGGLRDLSRRPRKYFVAARAMAGGSR
jgi:hypothetical protein